MISSRFLRSSRFIFPSARNFSFSTEISSNLTTSPNVQLVLGNPTDSSSFLQNVKAYFDDAATYSNIRHDLLNIMREGRTAIKMMLTLVRDNGKVNISNIYKHFNIK